MSHRSSFQSPVHRRLAPLIAASFFGGVALWVPIEKLFLAELGFTPQTIGLMAAAYAVVVPVLEIPSGILADRWSRRGVLLVGNLGALLSVLVGGLSTNVASYLVAALLLGVYFAMQSGTLDAIVYDTVVEQTGDSDQFEAIVGRLRMVQSASLVLSALAGGVLADAITPRAAYFATLPFLVASTVFLAAFREAPRQEAGEARSLRQHAAITFTVIRRDRRLLPVAALLVLTATLTQAVFEFGPLWLVEAGSGPGAFGPAWAGLMASLGLGGALASRLRPDSTRTALGLGALLVSSAATLMISSHVAIVTVAQIVAATLAVAIGIFLTRVLHDAVPSDVRSAVASGIGAATWATFLPFAFAFGALSERWGVHTAGAALLALAVAIAGLLLVPQRAAPTTPQAAATDGISPLVFDVIPCPATT